LILTPDTSPETQAGPDWLVIVAAFGYITLVSLPPAMIPSLGEEIG
jgi:hypothetical protein